VVREAALTLLPDAGSLDPVALTAMLEPDGPAHRRRAGLRLVAAHGGLPALRAAVALLDDPDAMLRARALQCLCAWSPDSTVKGDPEVAALLERSRDRLPRSRLRFLTWATGTTLAGT
jgi:hypothetical protein